MKKQNLEKAKNLIKKVDIAIRNNKISNYIIDNISNYICNKKSKIEINDTWFVGIIKKNKESFMVTFNPSIENPSEIYIDCVDLNGCRKLVKQIQFEDNMIHVKETTKQKYISGTKGIEPTYTETTTESVYLDNDLIYYKYEIEEVSPNQTYKEIKHTYTFPEKIYVESRLVFEDDRNISIKYFKSENYQNSKFNDKDENKQGVINYISASNEDFYNKIKNDVEKMLKQKTNIKTKK